MSTGFGNDFALLKFLSQRRRPNLICRYVCYTLLSISLDRNMGKDFADFWPDIWHGTKAANQEVVLEVVGCGM